MAGLINTNYAIKEADTPQSIQINKVNMKGVRPQFRGISDDDTFEYSDENKNKKKTALIVILSVLVAAGGGVGFLAHKGGKTLGKEAKFWEKIEQGWKELFGKGKDIKNNKPDNNRPNNNNPADNNKPPKSNGETPNETKPNDTKSPDTEPPKTQTLDEQPTIETEKKPDSSEGTPKVVKMFQKQTKEEVLNMFEGEEREEINNILNELEETNIECSFGKNGNINFVKVIPKEEVFDNFVDQSRKLKIDGLEYDKLKSDLEELYNFEFNWKSQKELLYGLIKAGDHIHTSSLKLDTRLYCPGFSEEEIDTIVGHRVELIKELGIVSKFEKDIDNSITMEMIPTEATKQKLSKKWGIPLETITDESLDIFADEGLSFRNFEEYMDCALSYIEKVNISGFNATTDNIAQIMADINKLQIHYPGEDYGKLLRRLISGDYNKEFLL